jgi:hypothetical protein
MYFVRNSLKQVDALSPFLFNATGQLHVPEFELEVIINFHEIM